MFQEFPDDNKNEDFLNEFRQKIAEQSTTSFEERKNELNRSKNVFIGAVSGVVLAGIVGWFVLSPRYAQEGSAEVPVIRRPQAAIKVQPTEPGGMEILNQDKSVYGILDKNEDDSQVVENLLPPPEEPKLPVIAPTETTAPQIETATNVEELITQQGASEDITATAEKIIKISEAPKATAVKEEKAADQTQTLSQAMNNSEVVETKVVEEVKTMEVAPKEEKTPVKEDVLDLKIPTGSWQIQLMSSNNKTSIEKSWKTLTKKYSVLANQPYEIETADLGAKGIYYRLKAGAFKTKAQADTLCNDIKALGGTCIVKKK